MPTNTYDPTAAQPYQAYQPPEPAAPPPPVPQSQPFQFTGAPISKAGAAAGLLDNIFKGYMNGKAAAAQKVAGQFKAKSDNLRASYEQDAQRLDGLARSGADPNSDDYKMAVSAVQGSWGAMKEWQDKIINGPDGNKPKKSKKSAQGQGQQSADQPQTPQQQLQQLAQDAKSPDPKVKLAALHKIDMMKGPPVLWQIKQYQSPEYQAHMQTSQLDAQSGLSVAQAQTTTLKLGQQYAELRSKPKDQQTPAEQKVVADYEQAYNVVNPPKPAAPPKPGDATKAALDEVVERIKQGGKLTDADREVFRANKIDIDPKSKISVTAKGEIIEETPGANPPYKVWRGPQRGYGEGGDGGDKGMLKSYDEAVKYFKRLHPEKSQEEIAAMARRKVEGAGLVQSGELAHDAIKEPQQFDDEVLDTAIGKMRDLPQYKDRKNPDGTPFSVDDAILNVVEKGEDGWRYRPQSEKPKPDKNKKYYYGLDEDGVKSLERDLQTQMRNVVSGSKETAITPEARRAFTGRTQPLFIAPTPSAQAGGGASPGSPQAAAAPSAAPASSPASQGGKSQFMAIPNPKGLREPGNLPIWDRPTVQNADGSHSSEYSTSFRDEKTGNEVLVPTVVNGKFLTPDGKKPREGSSEEKAMFQKAWQHYLKTGENLGKFDNPHDADSYANALHNRGNQSGKGGHIVVTAPDGNQYPFKTQAEADRFKREAGIK
jgi:hypothetical protein